MSEQQLWVVRTGVGGKIATKVEEASMIAIGWSQLGPLSNFKDREELKTHYRSVYPDDSDPKVWVAAGQLYRFVNKINKGDLVLVPLKATREVLIGEVTGDYDFTPKAVSKDYPNIRKVKWLKKISRDNLSPQCKYAIGGIMTVFQVNGYLPEIKAILNEKTTEKVEIPEAEEPITEFYRHVHEKANEMISDLLSQIEAYDFQGLVAGVLRAMGFRTQESSPGQDLGVDILAHPDAFGFELPRIKVQVKHRKGAASAPEIRQLIGTLQVGENGLFVSTGGFTQGALREPGSGAKVTLVDHDKFTEFLLEHYEKLEPEYKALIPLRKVYIPTKPRL